MGADPFGFRYTYSSWRSVNQQSVSVQTAEEKQVVLHTQDGDTVTLNSSDQTETTYAGYSALGISQGTFDGEQRVRSVQALTQTGQSFTFLDERNMTISVEGELSAAEIADIRKAVEEIDRLMTPLLNGGNPERVISQAAKLLDLENISGVEADYKAEKSVVVSQSAYTEQVTYTRQGEMPHPEAAAMQSDDTALSDFPSALMNILDRTSADMAKLSPPILQLLQHMRQFYQET